MDDDEKLHHPHDKLFKLGFSDPVTAAAFLREQIPARISDAVDWPSLKLLPGSFIDPRFQAHESDLLFSADLPGCEANIDNEDLERNLQEIKTPELKNTAMTLAQKLRQEGLQEGLQVGQQKGRVSTLRENLLDTLDLRFGKVPAGLAEIVAEMSDENKLRSLLHSAIRSSSIEQFSGSL